MNWLKSLHFNAQPCFIHLARLVAHWFANVHVYSGINYDKAHVYLFCVFELRSFVIYSSFTRHIMWFCSKFQNSHTESSTTKRKRHAQWSQDSARYILALMNKFNFLMAATVSSVGNLDWQFSKSPHSMFGHISFGCSMMWCLNVGKTILYTTQHSIRWKRYRRQFGRIRITWDHSSCGV